MLGNGLSGSMLSLQGQYEGGMNVVSLRLNVQRKASYVDVLAIDIEVSNNTREWLDSRAAFKTAFVFEIHLTKWWSSSRLETRTGESFKRAS